MEEYKITIGKIAKAVSVPSFYSLLLAGSAIFLAYAYLFDSPAKTATGILCLSLSLLALYFYIRRISPGFPAIFLHASIPLFIILLLFIRIFLLWHFVPVGKSSARFTAFAESVKALRYSNEVVLTFIDPENIKSGLPASENTAIIYINKDIKINPWDELAISAKPKEIRQDNKNISPFEADLLRKGFHYIFYLNDKNFRITKNAPAGLKDKIRNLIEDNLRRLFDKKTVPVLKGLYFANGSYIDKSTTMDFKRAGVLHILAASGEHIGIIAGALLILFTPLLINRKALHIIISLILFFYLYITDMPVSLLRAFVMYYIFSIQYIFDLDRNILNTLFLSAIVILLIYPYELYSLGFQLSYGATFGIIIFFNFYNDAFSFLPAKISKTLSVTLSAQAIVFPVIYAHMKEINLAGLASNIILVFTMSATLILSLVANLISVISVHLARYVAFLTDTSYSISLYIIQYLSSVNWHFMTGSKSYVLLLPYLLFLMPVLPLTKNRKIMSLSVIASAICAWLILAGSYSANHNKIAISNMDNKIIILLKEDNDPVLFGRLGSIEAAEALAKYLNANNIRNINIYIPVPDYASLKSCTYLIKKTIVSKCFISRDFMFSGYFKRFCQMLDTDGIKLGITEFKNYKKNITPNYNGAAIKKIFDSPFENITAIYNLLMQDYDLKNAVMENIIACGYEVEYVD